MTPVCGRMGQRHATVELERWLGREQKAGGNESAEMQRQTPADPNSAFNQASVAANTFI